jgi:multicomponent Na+:H+ antiporter subunit G
MSSDWIAVGVNALAVPFFIGGSVGLLRFPDFFTRLHALTKADNIGLGFVVTAGLLQAGSWTAALKLVLIWGLILASSSTATYLMARSELSRGTRPWRRR